MYYQDAYMHFMFLEKTDPVMSLDKGGKFQHTASASNMYSFI